MAIQLQKRRGTVSENNTFTGAEGEITVDTTNKRLRLHDGFTIGGIPIGDYTNVKDFGAIGDGVADDTAALQAALDTGTDIIVPPGKYVISASLELSEACSFIGNTDSVNTIRNQVQILPSGNFPCFTNKLGHNGQQYKIEGFHIFWSNVMPTDEPTHGNKYGFYFVSKDANPWTMPYTEIKNIEVNGAWGIYYDNTDNYKNSFKNIVGRYCRSGYYKRLGTMMIFDSCSCSHSIQAFHIENSISPTLRNCSADSIVPTSDSVGLCGIYINNVDSFVIDGWDAEGAAVAGNAYSYFNIRQSIGSIQGFTGLGNSLDCATGELVSFMRVTDSSRVTFIGFNTKYIGAAAASLLQFLGSAGTCATLYTSSSAISTLIGSDFSSPVNGTPDFRYSVYGNGGTISPINTKVDNLSAGTSTTIDGHIITDTITSSGLATFNGGIEIEDWIVPTLLNSWVVSGDGTEYKKNAEGLVKFVGSVKNGVATQGTIIFTLPVGYRPDRTIAFPVVDNYTAVGTILIDRATGNVVIWAATNVNLDLSSVSFYAV